MVWWYFNWVSSDSHFCHGSSSSQHGKIFFFDFFEVQLTICSFCGVEVVCLDVLRTSYHQDHMRGGGHRSYLVGPPTSAFNSEFTPCVLADGCAKKGGAGWPIVAPLAVPWRWIWIHAIIHYNIEPEGPQEILMHQNTSCISFSWVICQVRVVGIHVCCTRFESGEELP